MVATTEGHHGERLAALEAERHHMATKADIANLKVWMMVQTVGIIGAVAGLLRFFLP